MHNSKLHHYTQLPLLVEGSTPSFNSDIVTFKSSAKEPFARWYPYLEGYAPQFVEGIIKQFSPSTKVILDPFGGTATTAFVGAAKGVNAFICEVNPVMRFIFDNKVKVRSLDYPEKQVIYKQLVELSYSLNDLIKSATYNEALRSTYNDVFGRSEFFTEHNFEQILRLRQNINELNLSQPLLANLLTIAVLSSLVPCSLLKRAGDVRYKTQKELEKGIPNIENYVSSYLRIFAEDILQDVNELSIIPKIVTADARDLATIESLKVDTVITSPPYVNGTNYFRNTKLELWFLGYLTLSTDLASYRRMAITAGINDVTASKATEAINPAVAKVVKTLEKSAYDTRIPKMVASYFNEMTEVFDGVSKHLVNNAVIAIDIGDSIYNGVHVPADQLLIECLKPLGYELQEDIQLRKRHSNNGDLLRQALLVFHYKKPVTLNHWVTSWNQFKITLPHQQEPHSKRNWGNELHSLCSYQGKLKPAIAHYLVKTFVPEGGCVLDPFSGVGTIPFEASLQKKASFAIDLSDMAYVITKAKLGITNAKQAIAVVSELEEFLRTYQLTDVELTEAHRFGFNKKLLDYYHIETLREVFGAKHFFGSRIMDASTALVYASCLHLLHGNRPYALSRRSHPITPYAPTGEFEYRALIPRLWDKVRRSLNSVVLENPTLGFAFQQDSTEQWSSKIDNLDAVITSPPFFDSTRFYLANWLRLWFSGWTEEDFKEKPKRFIDERQKESFLVYEPILRQSKERLKNGGVVVLHLGKSHKSDMAEPLIALGKQFFAKYDLFVENVEHVESHGIRDKGTVTSHQYLLLFD